MRNDYLDPDDLRPNTRTGRTIYGHMSFCPLRWCIRRHGPRSSFTTDHVEAADKMRLVFDGSRLGFSGLRDWRPVNTLTFGPTTGPSRTAMKQYHCRRRFDEVWSIFNEDDRAILLLVVLQNISIGRATEMLGASKPRLTQRLVSLLDRLCAHYEIGERSAA
jgi:hypothetical protein